MQLGLFDVAAAADPGLQSRRSARPDGAVATPAPSGGPPPVHHRDLATPAPPEAPLVPAGSLQAPVARPPRGSGSRHADVPVVFVRHPRARRYLIRVRVDGSVRVTIPRRGSRREATEFYEQQRSWVVGQLERVAQLRERMPADLPVEEQRRLRSQAKRELPARLLELAAATGIPVRKVSVRNQKHRWGSCSASGSICLNWRLITMPDWVRDYVIYHELMHVKRMDHSPAFWRLVAAVCPNYQDARRWLRRHAHAPHVRTPPEGADNEAAGRSAGT